ncbi:MAG: hypothetical protein P1P76_12370 [Anaerolineales bacterium]|nr:hypothetical protein [Anaerolineales bacterium]
MLNKWWRLIHNLIILNFLVEIIYTSYMVFFAVGGSRFPLLRSALETPIEIIMKRRLYAIETWLAVGGLALYLAVTELLPRRLGKHPGSQVEDASHTPENDWSE